MIYDGQLLIDRLQTPAGWSSLEYQLPSISKKLGPENVKYVFPHAPTVAISINGGAGNLHMFVHSFINTTFWLITSFTL